MLWKVIRFHRHNGLAEKYVQIVKRTLDKAKAENKDPTSVC